MSQPSFPLHSKRIPDFRPVPVDNDDTILEDLRSFDRDIGVHGCSAMTKAELVESLRQRYLLDLIRAQRDEAAGSANDPDPKTA
jgi:hypothetical protein